MANSEASDIIEKALNEALPIHNDHEEGDLLVEWMAVCYVTNPDVEKRSAYPIFLSNGELPIYRVFGLIDIARSSYIGSIDD